MRLFLVMPLCVLQAGCGISGQADQQDAADPAPFDLNDALAECRHAYPDQITQASARAGCVIKATEQLRSVLPFPDLLDQENTLRKSLAGQVEGRKLSLIERNADSARCRPPFRFDVAHHSAMMSPGVTRPLLAPIRSRLSAFTDG